MDTSFELVLKVHEFSPERLLCADLFDVKELCDNVSAELNARKFFRAILKGPIDKTGLYLRVRVKPQLVYLLSQPYFFSLASVLFCKCHLEIFGRE